jgi:hypothetical protein
VPNTARSFIKFKAPLQSAIDSSLVYFEQAAKREEALSLQTGSPVFTQYSCLFLDTGYWNFDIDLKHRYMALVTNVKDLIISYRDLVLLLAVTWVMDLKPTQLLSFFSDVNTLPFEAEARINNI